MFAGPHAVSSVAGTVNANTATTLGSSPRTSNGDLTQGDGRTVGWTAFNMPSLTQRNSRQIAITYEARFKRVDILAQRQIVDAQKRKQDGHDDERDEAAQQDGEHGHEGGHEVLERILGLSLGGI